MNILHRALLIGFVLFSTTGVVVAQSTTTDATNETVTSSTTIDASNSTTSTTTTSETPLQELPIPPAEPVVESGTTLSPATQLRITNLAANLSNRFDAMINRLEHILHRLESRTTKIEATGQDVSAARTSLSTVRSLLNQARTEMTNVDSEVATVVGATNPRQEWQNLKDTYLSVRNLIQQSFTEMQNIIIVLKNPQSVTPDTSKATSTESTM